MREEYQGILRAGFDRSQRTQKEQNLSSNNRNFVRESGKVRQFENFSARKKQKKSGKVRENTGPPAQTAPESHLNVQNFPCKYNSTSYDYYAFLKLQEILINNVRSVERYHLVYSTPHCQFAARFKLRMPAKSQHRYDFFAKFSGRVDGFSFKKKKERKKEKSSRR